MSSPEDRFQGRVVVIGVAGGTASGKTTLVDQIAHFSGEARVAILRQDSYYKCQDHLSIEERTRTNYDHPDALDNALLVEHIRQLVAGNAVEVPSYDFRHHTRSPLTVRVEPRKVVLVEGILVLEHAPLRELMDLKIFVDADHDLRLLRRLRRDVEERGRTFDSVMRQYLENVRPMHQRFIEPSRQHADLVVPNGGLNPVVIGLLSSLVEMRNIDRRKAPRGPSSLF